jgi:serine protease Do
VEKGSPADKAGIEPGDVILKFNGKTVERSADLPPMVAEQTPGSQAKLEFWHKGKNREIALNVGAMKSAALTGKSDEAGNASLGLAVRPLTVEERRKADISEGLLVENVDNGPAAKAGIRPGDVILSLNGEKISSVEQLSSLIGKRGKRIALLIQRGDNKMFVPLNLG